MKLYSNNKYMDDVISVARLNLPWEKLSNKKIMISGSTGLIGSFIIDVLLYKNVSEALNCKIFALGRSLDKFSNRFGKFVDDDHLVFLQCNILEPIEYDDVDSIDYVLHLASNTHPLLYSTDPIGTVLTNILGVKNLLDFSVEHNTSRFIFASSVEVYGENKGDVEYFNEKYCGYINCNTLRAGYPESKRCGEALCQAYKQQKGLDIVIPRLARTYGPTMDMNDTKAASQFIINGVNHENVVLKSDGMQYFTYTYVSDAVSGLLTVLFMGVNGESYNIADSNGDIRLRDLASIIASFSNTDVIFKESTEVESAGYSKATKALLDGSKIKALGWIPKYDITAGIERTIDILQSVK